MREGWFEQRLGDVTKAIKGRKPAELTSKRVPGLPYLTADVLRGATTSQWIPSETLTGTVRLNGTETIILWDGAGAGDVFRSQIGVLASTMAKLESIDESVLSPEFLYVLLKYSEKLIKDACRGTTVPHVSPDSLTNLRAHIPPLSQQKRIVDLMLSIDAYVDSLQRQVKSANNTKNAIIEEIMMNHTDDWREVNLSEVLEISRGGSPRPIHDFITNSKDGVNWIKISDATLSSKYIYQTAQKIKPQGISRSRQVFSGDFILSNSMSFGRPYIMRTDGCIHDGWLLLSNVKEHFDEDFLFNLLNSQYVQQQFESLAAGSGVRNLNIDVVNKVAVRIPPKEIQTKVSLSINSFDDFVLRADSLLLAAQNLRRSTLSDLLSGKHEIPASYDRVIGAA